MAKRWWFSATAFILVAAVLTGIFLMSSWPKTDSQTTGQTLYVQNCASCHGALASSEVRGRTAAQIEEAILNIPVMNRQQPLQNLTQIQIQEIAIALTP